MAESTSDGLPQSDVDFVGPFNRHEVRVKGRNVPFLDASPQGEANVLVVLDHRFGLELSISPEYKDTEATCDYWYLCANCGYVTHSNSWLYLNYNPRYDMAPHEPMLIPAESDPSICRCPACGHEHKDDDSGPGFYDGTRESMIAERATLVRDGYEFESETTHAA